MWHDMYCLDLRFHAKAFRSVSGKNTDVHLLLAFRPVVLPLNFGIQWLGRIIPILEVPVFHSRPGCLAVVSEIRCSCLCRMYNMSPPRLSQYLPMQLFVTYTIEKASLTNIIVLHDVTSRIMAQAYSLSGDSPQRQGLEPWPSRVGIVVYKVALRRGFLRILVFLC